MIWRLPLLLTTAALWVWVSQAQAADVPTKAPPILAYPTTKCGGYLGINAQGSAAKVSDAPPGTIATGGIIGGLAGYACPTATFAWFIEGIADWQNLGTSNGQFSTKANFHGAIRGGVQTDLLQLLPQILPGTGIPTSLPSPTPPVLPPGASANGPMVNYVYGEVNFDDVSSQFMQATARDWLISPEIGTGLLTPVKLANGKPIVVDTWIGLEFQSQSQQIGTFGSIKYNDRWVVGSAIKF